MLKCHLSAALLPVRTECNTNLNFLLNFQNYVCDTLALHQNLGQICVPICGTWIYIPKTIIQDKDSISSFRLALQGTSAEKHF